jgi:SAM-dependent methyltransferase
MKAAAAEWFASWFDSPYYHQLYSHRDIGEAAAFLDALVDRLHPAPDAEILDLGCGAGRHARRLADHGFHVTGLDLSADSIRSATALAGGRVRFARHDMRVPFGIETYDCVLNLFTSFGYFDRAEDHLAVVSRRSDASYLYKLITIEADGAPTIEHQERVAKIGLEDLIGHAIHDASARKRR